VPDSSDRFSKILGHKSNREITGSMLEKLQAIDGQDIRPKGICLWLILDRQTEIVKISEIKSLIF
jgi:hypothetical protein